MPGWATQVPSWPSFASRSLSPAPCCRRTSFHSGSSWTRYLGRHPAHRVRAALVAGLDGQERVGPHERDGHRHQVPVREQHVVLAELLDVAEDVVPPAAVQARRVLAQLVEDLVHLEGRHDGLDEDRRLDGALRDSPARPGPSRRCRSTASPRGGSPSSAGRSTGRARGPGGPWTLWKKYRPKSKMPAGTCLPSTSMCFSTRGASRGGARSGRRPRRSSV